MLYGLSRLPIPKLVHLPEYLPDSRNPALPQNIRDIQNRKGPIFRHMHGGLRAL